MKCIICNKLTLFIAYILLSGCTVAVSNVDKDTAMVYQCMDGHLVRDYPLSYENAWDAANMAIVSLKFGLRYSYRDDSAGIFEAVHQNGETVVIALKSNGIKETTIAIKNNLLNTCKDAERVHNEIAKN